MLREDDLDFFRSLLGPGGVVTDSGERLTYETAARYGTGVAAAVLRPRTTAEVSAVVGYCVRGKLAFVVQSGNTNLVLGATPDATGEQIVISMERLNGPVQLQSEDRKATAKAGVRLSALNAALEPHNLFLPIDLGADPMVGGMTATNTGGARFLRYGDMRDHVLAMEVVLADEQGTVLRLGSGLRKDNARLNLLDLFVGSCGAMGVITEVTVAVDHRPRQTESVLLIPRDDRACLELLSALESSAGEFLTAFEGMSRAAMRKAFEHLPFLRNPFPGGAIPDYAILAEFTSQAPETVFSLQSSVENVLADIVAIPASPLADALLGRSEVLWALRHCLSEGLRASGSVIGFDLSLPRDQVFAFRLDIRQKLAAEFPEFEICDFGHVGDGGLHFNIVHRTPALEARIDALRELVIGTVTEKYGGSFSAEHGIGKANQTEYHRWVPIVLQHYSGAVVDIFARHGPGHIHYGVSSIIDCRTPPTPTSGADSARTPC